MPSTDRALRISSRRRWISELTGGPFLERVGVALIVLASIVGLITQIAEGTGPAGYLALILTLAGCAVSYWLLWPGVLLAVSGPLLGGLLGAEQVLVWTLTVFAAFLWCLRGASALIVGPVVGLANYAAFTIVTGDGWLDPLALVVATLTLASAAAGSAVASRRQYLAEAKLTREAEIERRISEERLRIARDLHDMVGHQTAVVNMHLGAAEVHLPEGADRSRSDLEAARRGVQAVIRETHQILDILRLSPGDDATAPNADFDHLAGLINSYRELGMAVEAHLDPAPAALDAEVSAATFRVVLEALTNARKHGTGPVSLTVREPTRRSASPCRTRCGRTVSRASAAMV
ncbi:sensor histidine kinase [Tessaracoccus sp. G1721]